ncbi:ORF1629 capsid protein [Operophtera brumata nucleopolyhedrovirus]|uniref:ORF1629 capsid protein n=1 Tax=Operophtera brumata nucleopolyhedrovirus TaxID=1046267 RepID=A0A2H4UZL3_9ABAC|nr:ORF1629 capsid protein [Operophtera brumata nucleopolyhedrovirus]AUA60233.1 ORF1629 capsid protein [Operophtera brumata nucleopolyhedrovirus]
MTAQIETVIDNLRRHNFNVEPRAFIKSMVASTRLKNLILNSTSDRIKLNYDTATDLIDLATLIYDQKAYLMHDTTQISEQPAHDRPAYKKRIEVLVSRADKSRDTGAVTALNNAKKYFNSFDYNEMAMQLDTVNIILNREFDNSIMLAAEYIKGSYKLQDAQKLLDYADSIIDPANSSMQYRLKELTSSLKEKLMIDDMFDMSEVEKLPESTSLISTEKLPEPTSLISTIDKMLEVIPTPIAAPPAIKPAPATPTPFDIDSILMRPPSAPPTSIPPPPMMPPPPPMLPPPPPIMQSDPSPPIMQSDPMPPPIIELPTPNTDDMFSAIRNRPQLKKAEPLPPKPPSVESALMESLKKGIKLKKTNNFEINEERRTIKKEEKKESPLTRVLMNKINNVFPDSEDDDEVQALTLQLKHASDPKKIEELNNTLQLKKSNKLSLSKILGKRTAIANSSASEHDDAWLEESNA